MHVGPEAPAVAESADGTRVVGVRAALVEDVTVGNRLLLWVRGHLPAPASLVSSVGQGMGPGFLGRGGRAQLRPPSGACPPLLSGGLLLGGCFWWAQEALGLSGRRPGFCLLVCAPNPRPPLVGCWANPGAVTSQGSVGTILLPQPPTAEGERGGTPPAP